MDTNQRHSFEELAAGAIHRVDDGAGTTIAVVRGRIWITQESDPIDRVLDTGESFCLDRPGLAIVQALGDASLLILDGEQGTAERPSNADRVAPAPSAARRVTAWELEAAAHRARNEMVASAVAGLYRRSRGLLRRLWRSAGIGAWRTSTHRG